MLAIIEMRLTYRDPVNGIEFSVEKEWPANYTPPMHGRDDAKEIAEEVVAVFKEHFRA